jgi:PGF-pre-PGF domain-containing protein
MTATPVPIPTSSPELPYLPDEGSESDNERLPVRSGITPLEKGDLMCQTVNVGGDSVISQVTVTGRNVSDIIVTAWITTSPPHNITLPARPVYEYIETNMSRCGVISDIRIEFALPHSIVHQNASPDAVSICMVRNDTWICLPTVMLGDKNGKAYYSANTSEFTFLAITVLNNGDITAGERFFMAEKTLKNHTSQTLPTPSVPASLVLPAGAAQNTHISSMTFFFLIAGTIGTCMCVFLIKKVWVRLKNRINK